MTGGSSQHIVVDSSPRVELMTETSALLLSVLVDAQQYRVANAHMYHNSPTPRERPASNEEVYWTSCDQVRSVLREQTQVLLNVCVREALEQARQPIRSQHLLPAGYCRIGKECGLWWLGFPIFC